MKRRRRIGGDQLSHADNNALNEGKFTPYPPQPEDLGYIKEVAPMARIVADGALLIWKVRNALGKNTFINT